MKNEQELFSIGEIIKALGVTRRIVLHYEERGLIRPDVRSGATGASARDAARWARKADAFFSAPQSVLWDSSFGMMLPSTKEVRFMFDGFFDLNGDGRTDALELALGASTLFALGEELDRDESFEDEDEDDALDAGRESELAALEERIAETRGI